MQVIDVSEEKEPTKLIPSSLSIQTGISEEKELTKLIPSSLMGEPTKLIPYFKETTLEIAQPIYEILNELPNEYFELFMKKLKGYKIHRIKSLKDICIYMIASQQINVTRKQVPYELLELIIYYKVKHRILFPTYFYDICVMKQWRVGKLDPPLWKFPTCASTHDLISSRDDYAIFEECEKSTHITFNNLPWWINKKMHLYVTHYFKEDYNVLLRHCPYIDTPVLNDFISYAKLFREWKS